MTSIGMLRSAHNERQCPLTNCFKCLAAGVQGFTGQGDAAPAGVFTLQAEDDDNVTLAKVFKAKGADAVHIVTCAFARKEKDGWVLEEDRLAAMQALAGRIAAEAGLPCVLGTAHLPSGFTPERHTP